MNSSIFFITSYDTISGPLLSSLINLFPDIHCLLPVDNEIFPDKNKFTIDSLIKKNKKDDNKILGFINYVSAYELQYKSLMEKTVHSFRKVNLIISPVLRINLILETWNQSNPNANELLAYMLDRLKNLGGQHSLVNLLRFDYFYIHIKKRVQSKNINISSPQQNLFLLALAQLIAYDSADFPVPGRKFNMERLLDDNNYLLALVNYVTKKSHHLTPEIEESRHEAQKVIQKLMNNNWEPWQHELLDEYLNDHLETIYFPHIDKTLADYYTDAAYELKQTKKASDYTKLVSIQLNSNRPAQLSAYFDNIEETADNPEAIEVLVNIDSDHQEIEALINTEIPKRKFTLKYIKTPKPKSFCDLWQPINKLFDITDPGSYFLLNISDEMFFATKGWDTILKKYIGFFPDHLFRLRASRNKFRNYFDRWECSFAQDAIPFTTKKWLDIGGDWNPCFGPDSFQQLISFYLAKNGLGSSEKNTRDIPIIDIQFEGDVPAIAISPQKVWRHHSDHIKAMLICQSYSMQLEACRRAMLIKANIVAHEKHLINFEVIDTKSKKKIQLISNSKVIQEFNYKVSWLAITLSNQLRKLRFFRYFGGGNTVSKSIFINFSKYLYMKYKFFYIVGNVVRKVKHKIKRLILGAAF